MEVKTETIWLVVGFVGQGMFFMRFLLQWLSSEAKGRSVIPVTFWYFSFAGGLTLLAYAIYRKDPVFIIGQSTGAFIYARNLQLIARERRTAAAIAAAENKSAGSPGE
ncbi:MAG: lipid-A-disaccharide synthase N-terminal domain-containing protein [Desulfobulbaceae bacterium]|nr:lipid-A-disaccharide synthase N-terminal domain-containing protein [Desulfobulbaceae bacterium]